MTTPHGSLLPVRTSRVCCFTPPLTPPRQGERNRWRLALPTRGLLLRLGEAARHLGGELAQTLRGLAGVLGPVGARALGEAGGRLQRRHAQQRLGEAAVLRILAQPALVLGILARQVLLHVDDHAQALG